VLVRATLSLQMHHHRARALVVVRGPRKLPRATRPSCWRERIDLYPARRQAPPGKARSNTLEIIEVQSAVSGEDDIVRFEDNYGRKHDDKIALITGVTGQDGAYLASSC